jgi:inhibitor of KinA sporulation pathway (predicted exonuclease)
VQKLAEDSTPSVGGSNIDIWICLDFEWTADEGDDRKVHGNEGEIIEFSFVVFDAKLGREVCEGQYYCKPERTPLTEFSTKLTGISAETLASAGSLADALDAFEDAFKREGLSDRRCCAVTHGPCDLELQLVRNCQEIGRKVPSVLRSYVDLREAAQDYVRTRGIKKARASTLKEICEALDVEMVGQEHCGLDDARMVLHSFKVLLNASINDLQIIDIDAERTWFLSSECTEQKLALDGLPFRAQACEIQKWLEGLLGHKLPKKEGQSVKFVYGSDNGPSGRAVVDLGARSAALAAYKDLACNQWSPGGRLLKMWFSPGGLVERVILVRPLRRQERDFVNFGRPKLKESKKKNVSS